MKSLRIFAIIAIAGFVATFVVVSAGSARSAQQSAPPAQASPSQQELPDAPVPNAPSAEPPPAAPSTQAAPPPQPSSPAPNATQTPAPPAPPAPSAASPAPDTTQPPATQPSASAPDESAPAATPGQKQTPAIHVTTQTVPLTITVSDKKHNFVTDLDKSDFRVLENGVPQDIRFFAAETDLPLRIAVLIDTSNSIRPRLQFEQDAAIDFLNRVIRPVKDKAFLMTFDNEPQIIQDYTDDVGRLSDSIRDQRAGGGTALNDALYMASEKLENPPLPNGPDKDVRKVIVLISDGNDNLSDRAPSDATEAIIRSGAAVYAISTNTDWITLDQGDAPRKYEFTEGDKILMSFSDQTGGRTFFPYKVEDLGESFIQIGTELRSQYFIAYTPTAQPDGKYRKIDVDVDRKGLVVRTRKGYYATGASLAAHPGH